MCPTNAAPGEEVAETRKSEKPVEELVTNIRSFVDECEKRETKLESHGGERAAFAVDVSKEFGGHALRGKSLESTRRAKGAGVGNGENGNRNDGVHDGGETLDAGVLDCNDEGRGFGVGAGGAEQELRVRGHDETDHEQIYDVEEEDTPEHLPGCLGKGLRGIGGLGRSQTSQFSAAESESSIHEHGAEALEAIRESTGVVPVASTNVSARIAFHSTAVINDGEEDKARASEDLDDAKDELDWTR